MKLFRRPERRMRRLLKAAGAGDHAALETAVDLAREGPAAMAEALWDAVPPDGPTWWRGWPATALWDCGLEIPQRVVDRAWREWFADGGRDDLWGLLVRWERPASGRGRDETHSRVALGLISGEGLGTAERALLLGCAERDRHPAGDIARAAILAARGDTALVDDVCASVVGKDQATPLTALCLEHGMVPGDPVRRALFHVLTGQHEQHRAFDPDGSLLAAAYRGASRPERTRLMAAMRDHGDYDVLRVVAGDRRWPLQENERRYLVDRLAERGEWDPLWRMALDLPLPQLVEVAGRFGDWRPADPAQRELLDLLVEAASERTLVIDALRSAGETLLRPAADHGSGLVATVSDVRWNRFEGAPAPADRRQAVGLLHLGEEVIAVEREAGESVLARYWRGGREEVRRAERMSGPVPFADGYAVLGRYNRLLFGRAGTKEPHREERLRDLLPGLPADGGPRLLASDPATGRLVVLRGDRVIVVDGYEGRVLAHGPGARGVQWLAFAGESDLVTVERHRKGRSLRTWRIGPPRRDGAPAKVVFTQRFIPLPGSAHVELLARFDRLAVRLKDGVEFWNPRTLEPGDPPMRIGFAPREAWQGPAGRWMAVSDRPHGEPRPRIEIHGPPWDTALRRPLADATAADLEAVHQILPHLAPEGPLRWLLVLYRACLEVRLDGEISLGRVTPFTDVADIDGIAL